jgi:SAM-dependent methyltransferase
MAGAPLDLRPFSAQLVRGDDGIWRGAGVGAVSYPEGGHEGCFAVEERSFWFAHRNRVIVDLLRRFPPTGALFDVGGGNGFVALALQQAGREVVVAEPGAEGCSNARGRGLDNVVCATFEHAGFAPRALPAIGMFDVVEHVADDVALLHAAAGRLRPDGVLFLTVPAHRWLWSIEDVSAGHFRRYDRGSLSRALATAGLEPMWMSHFFVWLPLPILLLRSLPTLLGRRRSLDLAGARGQHRLPAGAAGRLLARALDREAKALARGRRFRCGASIAAVARPGGRG